MFFCVSYLLFFVQFSFYTFSLFPLLYHSFIFHYFQSFQLVFSFFCPFFLLIAVILILSFSCFPRPCPHLLVFPSYCCFIFSCFLAQPFLVFIYFLLLFIVTLFFFILFSSFFSFPFVSSYYPFCFHFYSSCSLSSFTFVPFLLPFPRQVNIFSYFISSLSFFLPLPLIFEPYLPFYFHFYSPVLCPHSPSSLSFLLILVNSIFFLHFIFSVSFFLPHH